MSAIRVHQIHVIAGNSCGDGFTVDVGLDDAEADAVRRVFAAINEPGRLPQLYVERVFAGVRASGGGAAT